jgi:thiamine-phosphate pyrophosphorylase
VERAIEGGVNLVQLREKDLIEGELLELAQQTRSVTEGRALFFVNGSARVAENAKADGVHLPDVRPRLPALPAGEQEESLYPHLLIGRSVHDLAGARRAVEAGADYLQVGAIFPTESHPGGAPVGVDLIEQIREMTSLPLIAVGGIDETNAELCMAAGADGVAVISSIGGAPNPHKVAERLWNQVQDAYRKTE